MTANHQELLYQIGITQLPGIGPRNAKKLIATCGSARAVFEEKPENLENIERIGSLIAQAVKDKKALSRAETELEFIEKEGLTAHYYQDKSYPRRLRHCDDGPVVLFQKGPTPLNENRILAVVGTRSATEYGKHFCETFTADCVPLRPMIVSGLAYGIDAAAHKAAVNQKLPTVAVMAHGLDQVYPYLNRPLSEEILAAGGSLVSEFLSQSKPDRENFPKRNRIIAGMSDAVLVVEAASSGGALITAQLANSYHRDVFALPARHNDRFSEGCNMLIKSNRAAMLTCAKDLEYIMGWSKESSPSKQARLFESLKPEEESIFNLLESQNKALELEFICRKLERPVSKVLQQLMSLEIKGLVKNLPGKLYTKV